MKSAAEAAAYIKSLDVGYIGFNNFAAAYFWGFYTPRAREVWEEYRAAYTTSIYRDEYYEVLAINP